MPTLTLDSEKLVVVVRVTAIDLSESLSCFEPMASRASSSSMSVSRGLYLGDVSSLVIL